MPPLSPPAEPYPEPGRAESKSERRTKVSALFPSEPQNLFPPCHRVTREGSEGGRGGEQRHRQPAPHSLVGPPPQTQPAAYGSFRGRKASGHPKSVLNRFIERSFSTGFWRCQTCRTNVGFPGKPFTSLITETPIVATRAGNNGSALGGEREEGTGGSHSPLSIPYSLSHPFGSRGPNPASFPHVSSGGREGGGGAGAWPRKCRTSTGLPLNMAQHREKDKTSRCSLVKGIRLPGRARVRVYGRPLASPTPLPLLGWWRSVPHCLRGKEGQAACLHFPRRAGAQGIPRGTSSLKKADDISIKATSPPSVLQKIHDNAPLPLLARQGNPGTA
ncbi:PREDICTED: uncharacterized protein LOC108498192 [Lepidothrix coronata]|uniref:Uncharacterized protein LOC108498192 n=1 Tax=Lepidothrix coronata TaxID=321398 RepID=A0A6J0HBZ4_9PASS|nr:PREDICTED: uncharacterized protein LOC108498192 [Lepidothrix coronata]